MLRSYRTVAAVYDRRRCGGLEIVGGHSLRLRAIALALRGIFTLMICFTEPLWRFNTCLSLSSPFTFGPQ